MGAFEKLEVQVAPPTTPAEKLNCGQIQFNFDSHIVLPRALPVVAEAIKYARANPDKRLLFAGHTDIRGQDRAGLNKSLSAARAYNVMALFLKDDAPWALSACDWLLNLGETQGWRADDSWANPEKRKIQGSQAKYRIRRDLLSMFHWAAIRFPDVMADAETEELVYDVDAHPDWGTTTTSWVNTWTRSPYRDCVAAFKKGVHELSGGLSEYAPVSPRAIDKQLFQGILLLYRLALVELVMNKTGATPAEFAEMIAPIQLVGIDPPAVGCAHHHRENTNEQTEKDHQENRRVEILFYERDAAPTEIEVRESEDKTVRYGIYTDYTYTPRPCPGEDPGDFMTVKFVPGDHVFVIDQSGSMNNTPRGCNESLLDKTKRELRDALQDLGNSQAIGLGKYRFALLAFSDGIYPYLGGRFIEARQSEIRLARDWVGNLGGVDSTNTYKAVEYAFGRGVHHYTIYFLSDGCPSVGPMEPPGSDIQQRCRAVLTMAGQQQLARVVKPEPGGERVKIHTFSYKPDTNLANFLRDLAENHHGSLHEIP